METKQPLGPYICSDAACAMNADNIRGKGKTEYQGIFVDQNGNRKQIFHYHFGDTYATNNIGEFGGLVHLLHWAETNNYQGDLYCDSKTAISWVKKGKANTKMRGEDTRLDYLLSHFEKYLKTSKFDMSKIKHWHTKHFGEIAADFNRK